MRFNKRFFNGAVIVLVTAWLLGPVAAAALRYSDRRGPKIYPETYHEIVFIIAYEAFHDGEKPRLSFSMKARSWFY